MKKPITLLCFLAITVAVSAQYYYSYNESNWNELSKHQLETALENVNQTVRNGKVATFCGGAGMIAGYMVYGHGLHRESPLETLSGVMVMSIGVVVTGVGIPMWINNMVKADDIRIAISRFDETTGWIPTNNIGITIKF